MLTVKPERISLQADGEDMTFVSVALTDRNGIVKMLEDRKVTVEVSGACELAAIGSGNPITEESFTSDSYTSWKGCMGFYVRSKETAGEGMIRISADGVETVEQIIEIR